MTTEQRVVPNLWFNHNADKAVDFYAQVFDGFKIVGKSYYPKTVEEGLADFQLDLAGQELTIDFEVGGCRFSAINAGPEFSPNPSISFFYTCDSKVEIDSLWARLSAGGRVLMPVGEYPFSDYYGWVQDKFGYSWQLMLNKPEGDRRPKIVPSLLFTDKNVNRAEDAINFYVSVFEDSEIGNLSRYESDTGAAKKGSLAYGDFRIGDQWFAAMDSGGADHSFSFNEAISLMVNCKDQAEIDDLWDKLSVVPEAEQCGWLKDKYGVSWQIVPANMDELMQTPGAFIRMMQMKKLDIAGLKNV